MCVPYLYSKLKIIQEMSVLVLCQVTANEYLHSTGMQAESMIPLVTCEDLGTVKFLY